MSGPSRELPPLRVRITADPSAYLKALDKVVEAAKKAGQQIEKSLNKAMKGPSGPRGPGGGGKLGWRTEVKWLSKHLDGKRKFGQDLSKLIDKQTREQAQQHSKNLGDEISRELKAQRSRKQISDQQASEEHRQLRRQRMRQVSRLKEKGVTGRKARMAGGGRMGAMMQGLDGGSMMGARADMYMHKQSLGGLLGGVASFLKPAAEMETYAITIGQFSKSAEEAKATLAEMQEFALISPYSMESVVQGTSLMMRYGMAAGDAVKMTKMLGEVAGGNSAKMELLALAVGQTTSMGKLMGQELRQMTEHGFNPLQIAAEAMLGPNADPKAVKAKVLELSKLMRQGAIDAGLVTAALELSTSKGGKYAGQMAKQANSVSGLTSQIVESLKIAAGVIGKIFEEDTKKVLRTVLDQVGKLIKYLRAPENMEFIKAWGYFVIKVIAAIAAFHALGYVIAKVKWLFGSLVMVLQLLLPLFNLLKFAIMGIARAAIGPVVASFFTMYGAIVATTVVALALGAALAYVMYHANADIQKYNEELKKSNELTDKLSKHHASKHVQTMLEIRTEKDPAKRKELAENALKSAKIELQGKQSQISQQEQLVASLEPTIASAYQGGRKVWEGESATLEQLKQQREAQAKRVAELQGIVSPAAPGAGGLVTPDAPDWAKDPASAAAHFKSFLGGGDAGDGDNMPSTQSAYRRGSSEHALALYNHDAMSIGESAAAREEAERKQKEKEKIDLLQQIATNTKIQAGLNSVGTAAGDMVAGFLSGGRK